MDTLSPCNNSTGTLLSHSTAASDSTWSNKSASSVSIDRDYTKENVSSPIDLECKIQAERITKILNETIYKTKLAICLPLLVQDFKTLYTVLSPEHMTDLNDIFELYANPLASGDLTMKHRLSPELGHLIYIMNSYPTLQPKVAEIMDRISPPQPNLDYLLALEDFRDLAMEQMQTSAADEILVKISTRKMEAANARLVAKIAGLNQTLKEENERFEQNMVQKRMMIAKLEHELALFGIESKAKLKKTVLDSDRQMVLKSRSHAAKYAMLKEEALEREEAYTTLLDRHLKDEQSQRLRRCKMETQIQSWLQKYDMDMGEKQSELDDITENYEDEVRKIEELEEKLAEQDKEYIPLMEEREAEYHQEMTEKMNKFLREHAARVIQNAWRQIQLNRAEKKKLSKLLKAKQSAERTETKKMPVAKTSKKTVEED